MRAKSCLIFSPRAMLFYKTRITRVDFVSKIIDKGIYNMCHIESF